VTFWQLLVAESLFSQRSAHTLEKAAAQVVMSEQKDATEKGTELTSENLRQDEQMHEGHRERPATCLKRQAQQIELPNLEGEHPSKKHSGAAQPLASEISSCAPARAAWVWRSVGDAIPHELRCPISWLVMEDPVRTVDGQLYDRPSIEEWFKKGKTTSPMTNVILQRDGQIDLTHAMS
jgi:hypothetical protein